MELQMTENIHPQEEAAVYQNLLKYNLSHFNGCVPRDVGIYVKEGGSILAGLIGYTHGNWLQIKYLWVDESLRSCGVGSKLLDCAEEVARDRGCRHVFVDTFSFQAPKFYQQHGYQKVFSLEEYPEAGARLYFTKQLAETAPSEI